MTATNKIRPCNLCGEQTSLRLLYRRSGYEIVKCDVCSLVYLAQIPSKQILDSLYSETFFKSSKFSAGEQSSSYRNAVGRVDLALSLPGVRTERWLDLGCATGDFLVAASKRVDEVHGSDISQFAIQQARARGLANTQAGAFADLDYAARSFDLVSMWDLLEHVADPAATLRKAHAILKPSGYLLISTGDVESIAARLSGRFWHLMIPPFHIYFFSQKTIQRYLLEAGFEQVKISYPGKSVPLDFLIEKSIRLISPTLAKRIAPSLYRSLLNKIKLPINLFDIMTISARKAVS